MCQLHLFRLVNFVHGVIASILIYEFVTISFMFTLVN